MICSISFHVTSKIKPSFCSLRATASSYCDGTAAAVAKLRLQCTAALCRTVVPHADTEPARLQGGNPATCVVVQPCLIAFHHCFAAYPGVGAYNPDQLYPAAPQGYAPQPYYPQQQMPYGYPPQQPVQTAQRQQASNFAPCMHPCQLFFIRDMISCRSGASD